MGLVFIKELDRTVWRQPLLWPPVLPTSGIHILLLCLSPEYGLDLLTLNKRIWQKGWDITSEIQLKKTVALILGILSCLSYHSLWRKPASCHVMSVETDGDDPMRTNKGYLFIAYYSKGVSHCCLSSAKTQSQAEAWKSLIEEKDGSLQVCPYWRLLAWGVED